MIICYPLTRKDPWYAAVGNWRRKAAPRTKETKSITSHAEETFRATGSKFKEMPETSEDKTTENEDGDHCQSDLDVVERAVH